MKEFVAALVTLGTGVIAASVVYQTFKPQSQGPKVTGQAFDFGSNVVTQLFK